VYHLTRHSCACSIVTLFTRLFALPIIVFALYTPCHRSYDFYTSLVCASSSCSAMFRKYNICEVLTWKFSW